METKQKGQHYAQQQISIIQTQLSDKEAQVRTLKTVIEGKNEMIDSLKERNKILKEEIALYKNKENQNKNAE